MGMEISGIGPAGMGEHPLPDPAVRVAPAGASSGSQPAGGLRAKAAQSEEEVRQALDSMEQAFRLLNHRLQFSVNRDINRVVVKVIDRTTDKVIKEIPPEQIQHMAARIREMVGLLVDENI